MVALATEQDRLHLRRALELAEHGRGRVSPNPLVGAVLVSHGEVIGEGYHAEFGRAHAEVAAIEDCRARGGDPSGATLYVTLEPCAHHGKQPPCTDAIRGAGIARVVVGSDDPSEKAGGRGPGVLRDEGITVEMADGPEAAAARLLNQAFRKHARTGRPLVVLKLAMSLDGRVAAPGGEPRWISGEESRALVHRWRAESDAVAVGIGTALADDPLLTARTGQPVRQPTRVVFDSTARLPLDSKLVASIPDAPLVIVVAPGADLQAIRALERAGAEPVVAGGRSPEERVSAAATELGRRGITSLLLEGGPKLAGAFAAAEELDQLRLFLAPLLLGAGAPAPIAPPGRAPAAPESSEPALRPLALEWERSGQDLLARARMREW
jgi:diaminohydroxyphosphoribosylaminopyrimidine deaminase / 5-amino-6-(5-phosphoribosylamino)uracil reductase